MSDYPGLIDFIGQRNAASKPQLLQNSQHEQVSAYLLSVLMREGNILHAPFAKRHDAEHLGLIEDKLRALASTIELPIALVERHPGVSAAGMQNLLCYFADYTKDVENLLPAPPESEDSYSRLIRIFQRVNDHLYPAFMPEALVPLHVLVTLEWMRGLSLASIIARRIAYHTRHGHEVVLPTVIRNTMELVEQTARFRAPKYAAAYMDVLNFHLKRIGRHDLIDADLDFGVMLEFGLSTKTLMSLIRLGLSRMTAVALNEKIVRDDLDQDGCRSWIAEMHERFEGMGLPAPIIREVRAKVLGVA